MKDQLCLLFNEDERARGMESRAECERIFRVSGWML